MRYTTEERLFLVKLCIKSEVAGRIRMTWVRHRFLVQYHKPAPSEGAIRNLLKKHNETGSVLNDQKGKSGRPKTVRNQDNIERVRLANIENRETSTRRLSAELDVSRSSIQRILKRDLKLFPYHIQNRQALSPRDKAGRVTFARQFQDQIARFPFFIRRIHFSDESHFQLNGQVNSHNAIYWGNEKPTIVNHVPLHSEKVTVWAAVSFNGVVGPYFFEEEGQTVTVNKERYQQMLQDFFIPEIAPIGNKWLQQDGATAHTANTSMALLREHFGDHLISLKTDFPWPAHSPDLSPLDFWLWGDLKGKVYNPKPRNREELKAAIIREMDNITLETCRNAIMNIIPRLEQVLELEGDHFEHLL